MLDGDDLFRSSDEIIGKEAAPAFARRAVFAGERVNFGFEDDPAPIFERADFLRDGEIDGCSRVRFGSPRTARPSFLKLPFCVPLLIHF